MSNSIPIRKIQKYLFCKRQYYLECVLSVPADPTYEMLHGEILHKRVDTRKFRSKKRKVFGASVEIESTLGIHGIADLVEEDEEGKLIVVEFRRSGEQLFEADRIGLAAYALCLEEQGYTISHLEVYSFKTRRRLKLSYSKSLRDKTIKTIREIHRQTDFPPTDNQKKCSKCANLLVCRSPEWSTKTTGFIEELL